MPSLRSPGDLLATELKRVHSAERQLARALPKFARNATSENLREMIDRRREEGGRLIEELEDAMQGIGLNKGRAPNQAIEGLLGNAEQQLDELEQDSMRDAAMIGEIQKIEHYCIAAWGTSKTLAGLLDHQAVVEAMARALDEGKRFDEEMTELAESEINPQLLRGEEEEGEESASGRTRRGGRGRARKAAGGKSAASRGARGRSRSSGGTRAGSRRKGKSGRRKSA